MIGTNETYGPIGNGPTGPLQAQADTILLAPGRMTSEFDLYKAQAKLQTLLQALSHYGSLDDHEAACKALARIATKAMRRK